jgi:dipeptidyl aminopeptidase/acylaminoacyl peptidase
VPDLCHTASPYDGISINTVPTALWHAYNDTVVPVDQSIQFFARLQSYHIYCQLTTVPNLAHGFLTNPTYTHELDGQAVAFLHHLGY